MGRALAAALFCGAVFATFGAIKRADAQGVYIGPGGVGVDRGDDYRDDRDYRRERFRHRDDDDDDYRPRRRRHYRDDDDDR